MSKKDEFKKFASSHPELNDYVNNGSMTWQKFFEMYDKYLKSSQTKTNSSLNMSSIPKIIKNIDMNSIQEHINTAQKALGVIQELTTKNTSSSVINAAKGPTSTRPINKFFED